MKIDGSLISPQSDNLLFILAVLAISFLYLAMPFWVYSAQRSANKCLQELKRLNETLNKKEDSQ